MSDRQRSREECRAGERAVWQGQTKRGRGRDKETVRYRGRDSRPGEPWGRVQCGVLASHSWHSGLIPSTGKDKRKNSDSFRDARNTRAHLSSSNLLGIHL